MGDEVTKDPAVGLYFSVSIDSIDLGAFSTCDGLSVEVQTEDREEGGQNGFVHKLPVRVKYTNVKFTRPIGPDSSKVAKWFAGMATGVKQANGAIAVEAMMDIQHVANAVVHMAADSLVGESVVDPASALISSSAGFKRANKSIGADIAARYLQK